MTRSIAPKRVALENRRYLFTLWGLCAGCVWEGGSGVQVAHPRHRAGACTLNAVGLLPVSGRGDARVAPPCPTTLCVWRRLPYLTLPGHVPTNACAAHDAIYIAFSQGQCATCGAQRLLKYAHRTMCCRYACLKAAAAKRRARHADGSADDAVAMCSASRSWRCLACTSAIPISSSQRSSATSWLLPTRPYATSRADRSKRTSTHRLHRHAFD